MKNNISILGITINNLQFDDYIKIISGWADENICHQVVTANPEILLKTYSDSKYFNLINSSDLVVPDGFGLSLVSKLTMQGHPNRIPGVDMIEHLVKKGLNIYLLGGKEGVAKLAKHKLESKYPQAKIVGAQSGGKVSTDSLEDKIKLINDINSSGASVLVVAFGAPKQEIFINHFKSTLKVGVAIGAGGSLDYLSESVKRSPKVLRVLGLEWLGRLFFQPWRLKRIFQAVVVFPIVVFITLNKRNNK